MNKPNIVISKCLNFDSCRFNGAIINDEFLLKLNEFVNFIPVCPEVEIGLGTPRLPLRLHKEGDEIKLFQPSSDTDLTIRMNKFCESFLASQNDIDGFVLKNRSPSCGVGDVMVYDKKESHAGKRSGNGLFSQNIIEKFENTPIEDEGRLKNFKLREEFLTKIFCIADFREVRNSKKISKLQDFQAKNKYLFMFYSPEKQIELGQIIASYNKTNIEEILENYFLKLLELFSEKTKIGKMINALSHIFGYFKNECSPEEKEFFIETLNVYREGRIPTSSVIFILKTWALRDKKEYILNQTILNPYPKKLVELSDSGKVLKL